MLQSTHIVGNWELLHSMSSEKIKFLVRCEHDNKLGLLDEPPTWTYTNLFPWIFQVNNRTSLWVVEGCGAIKKPHKKTQRQQYSDELQAQSPADFSAERKQDEMISQESIKILWALRFKRFVDKKGQACLLENGYSKYWRYFLGAISTFKRPELTQHLLLESRRTRLFLHLRPPSQSFPQIVAVV